MEINEEVKLLRDLGIKLFDAIGQIDERFVVNQKFFKAAYIDAAAVIAKFSRDAESAKGTGKIPYKDEWPNEPTDTLSLELCEIKQKHTGMKAGWCAVSAHVRKLIDEAARAARTDEHNATYTTAFNQGFEDGKRSYFAEQERNREQHAVALRQAKREGLEIARSIVCGHGES